MKFFLDNNLSYRLAEALSSLSSEHSDQVVHLSKKFEPGTDDETWIRSLGKEGDWVVVSGDGRIRKRPAEQAVFKAAKLTTFFLAPGWIHAGFWKQAYLLVMWWPRIMEQARLVEPGAIFEVPFRHTGNTGKFIQV